MTDERKLLREAKQYLDLMDSFGAHQVSDRITALLAAPAPEPVATVYKPAFGEAKAIWHKRYPDDGTKLYTLPQEQK